MGRVPNRGHVSRIKQVVEELARGGDRVTWALQREQSGAALGHAPEAGDKPGSYGL